MTRHWFKVLLGLAAVLSLSGCYFRTLPDPNAMTQHKVLDAEIMRRNIQEAHRILGNRIARGEISETQKNQEIDQLVQKYSMLIEVDDVPAKSAWAYADVLRQAGRLEDAEKLYETAVEIAPDKDRLVNDTLQLARVKAALGNVDETISLVRSTFDAPETERAPILLATLYDIEPEATGKGKDVEFALLLKETIYIHQSVIVNPETPEGQAHILAMPNHINAAWGTVIRLLDDAGAQKELEEAVVEQMDMAAQSGSF